MFKHVWVERRYVIWPNPKIKKQKLFLIILLIMNQYYSGCGHSAGCACLRSSRREEETAGGYSTAHAGNSSVS